MEFRYILGLIEQNKCQGSEAFLKERLDNIENNWKTLIECCTMKTKKLMEASDQQKFSSGVQDEEFWLGEVRLMMCLQVFSKSTRQLIVESLLMGALSSKQTKTTERWQLMPCGSFFCYFWNEHDLFGLIAKLKYFSTRITYIFRIISIPTCFFDRLKTKIIRVLTGFDVLVFFTSLVSRLNFLIRLFVLFLN